MRKKKEDEKKEDENIDEPGGVKEEEAVKIGEKIEETQEAGQESREDLVKRLETLEQILGNSELMPTIEEYDEEDYDTFMPGEIYSTSRSQNSRKGRQSILAAYKPLSRQRTLSINALDFSQESEVNLLDENGVLSVDQLKEKVEQLEKRLTEKDETIRVLTNQLKEADDTLNEWDQYNALTQNKNAALSARMDGYRAKHITYKAKTRQKLQKLGVEEKHFNDSSDEDIMTGELGDMLADFGVDVKSKKEIRDEDSVFFTKMQQLTRRTSANMDFQFDDDLDFLSAERNSSIISNTVSNTVNNTVSNTVNNHIPNRRESCQNLAMLVEEEDDLLNYEF